MGMLEDIINPLNLNAACKRVVRNGGSGGVDRMTVDELLPRLKRHGGDEIVHDLLDGRYRPCPVRRVALANDRLQKAGFEYFSACYQSVRVA